MAAPPPPVPSSSQPSSSSSSSSFARRIRCFFERIRRWLLLPVWPLLALLRRPSLWVGLISTAAYWDEGCLHGKFMYDDVASIRNNGVVYLEHPWWEAATRDFWGTPMATPASHKSFRPVTTLTFRWNWMYAERLGTTETPEHTYYFHVVNVLLHGITCAAVTECMGFVFDGRTESDVVAQLFAALLFGLHPVHAEAVSNITSRGEILMTLFFALAFLSFANYLPSSSSSQQESEKKKTKDDDRSSTNISTKTTPTSTTTTTTRRILLLGKIGTAVRHTWSAVCIYVIPWFCMTLSMFCKEQGATTLVTLVVYDFLTNHGSVREYFRDLQFYSKKEVSDSDKDEDNNKGNDKGQRKRAAAAACAASRAFLRRTCILAIETLLMCGLRYYLNGESSPDFVYEQNPAGLHEDRFTRVFSVNWVYCLYVVDAFYPKYLAPDWSGFGIDLIENWSDKRIAAVFALWIFVAACLASLFVGVSNQASAQRLKQFRRIGLMAFFGFVFAPFFISSNLIFSVGLMKADRVIYLPVLGICVFEALLLQHMFLWGTTLAENVSLEQESSSVRVYWVGYLLAMVEIFLFTAKLHERNYAWSNSTYLWVTAYVVNPKSYHTVYNCGFELNLAERYAECEYVLRDIADARVYGPLTTFVYAMALVNLSRCPEVDPMIEVGMEVIAEKRAEGGLRNTDKGLNREESSLLAAKAFCIEDKMVAYQTMFKAVEIDPSNGFAVQQVTALVAQMEKYQQVNEQRAAMGLPAMPFPFN